MHPVFFPTPAHFRQWLEENHETERELLVGFYKKGSGKPSITWPESVDEALCFGWIDGVRRTLDDESYSIRFTPRKPRSTWSAVNIARVEELSKLGLMRPAGQEAFERRVENRSIIYAYEQKNPQLDDSDEAQFRANVVAWDFFQRQATWYRKTALWWVVSAKKEETRRRRLASLIDHSAQGRTIPPLTRPSKST